MRKIGIYGGTFDPIHHGHLILAREALETLALDEIIFVPAAVSPHKLALPPTPAALRVEMLRAAIAGEERFCLDELELQRPPPSYTVETLEEFHRRAPEAELFYLLGSDNLPKLDTWHRAGELRRLAQLVVLHRGLAPVQCNLPLIARNIEISSTEIRKRVAAGQSIRYLVPRAVEEMILRRQLYRENKK